MRGGKRENFGENDFVRLLRLQREARDFLDMAASGRSPEISLFCLLRVLRINMYLSSRVCREKLAADPSFHPEESAFSAFLEKLPETCLPSPDDRTVLRALLSEAKTLETVVFAHRQDNRTWRKQKGLVAAALQRWSGHIAWELRRRRPEEVRKSRKKAAFLGAVLVALLFLAALVERILDENGLLVTYYRGTEFEEVAARRREKEISKNYELKAPAWRVPSDGWSSRWEGYLVVPSSADYQFFSQSLDGVRFIIDGAVVIDNWKSQIYWKASGARGEKHLEKGKHSVVVEHFDLAGPAALRIRWSGGGVAHNSVIAAPYLKRE